MGIVDFFRHPDINAGVAEYNLTERAVLLDVRTPEEYRDGHIPGSCNVPLQAIDEIESIVEDMETPLFVYCRSGNRSGRATAILRDMGYRNVKNIGGIAAYTGKQEH